MSVPQNDPLLRQVQAVQFTDSELKRLLINASNEAGSIMKSNASDLRKAQVALNNLSAQMWKSTGQAIGVGIGDAIYNSAEYQALFDEDLFRAAGLSSKYWRQSMIAQASQGIQNVISRKENGIALSDKVWKSDQLTRTALHDTINTGLLLGKSPAEIAKSVVGYLNPAVPGGASYAAMRLGRTEVLNAYHSTTLKRYEASPWVDFVKWNLSGSHPKPDECNDYAENSHYKGKGAGIWAVNEVPGKPHPNCLCYVTPVAPSLDDFAKQFKAGKYDDYIDSQMGCARGA